MGRGVLEGVLVILEDLLVEDIVDVGGEVGSEMARDQHTSLLVQDVDGRDATHSNNYDLNYEILLLRKCRSSRNSLLTQTFQTVGDAL